MRIGIIGGGAIGLLFGGYLGREHQTTMMVRRKEQAALLQSIGITVKKNDKKFATPVKATANHHNFSDQDCIIVAVKQYHIHELFHMLLSIPIHIPLIFLQNGLGHLEVLEKLPHSQVFVATVEHGASKVTEQCVKHNGVGQTNIAIFRGNYQTVAELIDMQSASFPFVYHNNNEVMLLQKLLVNATINPLTATLGVQNGRLIHNKHYYQLLLALFEEIIVLFPQIDREKMKTMMIQICTNTKNNQSSMLKDVENGRRTEIEGILGFILDKAEKEGREIPITWSLYHVIKGKEREGRT